VSDDSSAKPERAYAPGVSVWLVWLIIAAALAVGEVLTLTFVLAMFAGGAAAAALVVAAGGGGVVAGVTFAAVSGAGLVVIRPLARRHHQVPTLRTGAAAMVGKRGRTLTAVSVNGGGRVRVGGEEWSASPYDDSLVIPEQTWVDVLAIDGATAVVHPIVLPLSGSESESR
jgi:membrane protein implicated in regulation of membrane protease activity